MIYKHFSPSPPLTKFIYGVGKSYGAVAVYEFEESYGTVAAYGFGKSYR